jgi:hypothetical protein
VPWIRGLSGNTDNRANTSFRKAAGKAHASSELL